MARTSPLFSFRYAVAVAVAAIALLGAGTARADPSAFEGGLAGLSRPSPEGVAEAVVAIGGSRDERALAVLQALRDGDLAVSDSGNVYLHDRSGNWRDVLTGAAPGAEPTHPPS